jgi:hypothetical protein
MSKPFVVDKASLGKVLNLGDLAGNGVNVSICFQPGAGAVVVKTIPERVIQAIKDEARDQRDLHKKGTMIGNTQRHWMPLISMPAEMWEQWKQELGEPKHNMGAWKKRLNSNEYKDLRTSDRSV